MSGAAGNPGMNNFARIIQERINKNQDANSALMLDFGMIQPDYSLLTNTFPVPIPKADYLVCRQLTLGDAETKLTRTIGDDGTHNHGNSGGHGGHLSGEGTHNHNGEGPHGHTVLIPEEMRWLKPGDRVLVAWVQHDAIVIDIILPAAVIG